LSRLVQVRVSAVKAAVPAVQNYMKLTVKNKELHEANREKQGKQS
jgi:hypothetical protein